MQITVGRLRKLFAEAMAEARVSAHPDYLKREKVRERIQQHVVELVKSGEIKTQEELDAFWETTDMAVKALKMLPINVWVKVAGTKKR